MVVVWVFFFGECCKVVLVDIVIFMGGMLISEDKVMIFDKVIFEDFGKVCCVIISKENIMIVVIDDYC